MSTANTEMTLLILRELFQQGVREVCLCPSTRNASLVEGFTAHSDQFKIYSFFEERSAAFFALGRIRQSDRPVAVVTTSGTAVGELLPATMEAYYAGLPLLLVSADRPRRYRGSGAPQAAEQVGIFGVYSSETIDLEGELNWRFPEWNRIKPVHINVCYGEPVVERNADYRRGGLGSDEREAIPFSQERLGQKTQLPFDRLEAVKEFFNQSKNPIIIVGALHPRDREVVVALLQDWQLPAYVENLSGLREDPRLSSLQVRTARLLKERAEKSGYCIDGAIRIGGVPTLRFWRDLDLQFSKLPVLSLCELPFSGLGRPSDVIHGPLAETCRQIRELTLGPTKTVDARAFLSADAAAVYTLSQLLLEEPQSEPALIADLSFKIPKKSRVYLGNSMPIRYWDLVATQESREYEVWGSRGLNGIDGQLSTFYGFAESGVANWAIVGDLTSLYDLSAPSILPQLSNVVTDLVLINNGGGRLFQLAQFFPNQAEFQNSHTVSFEHWGKMWKLSYLKWERVPAEIVSHDGHRLIELVPDNDSTERFWEKYTRFVK